MVICVNKCISICACVHISECCERTDPRDMYVCVHVWSMVMCVNRCISICAFDHISECRGRTDLRDIYVCVHVWSMVICVNRCILIYAFVHISECRGCTDLKARHVRVHLFRYILNLACDSILCARNNPLKRDLYSLTKNPVCEFMCVCRRVLYSSARALIFFNH